MTSPIRKPAPSDWIRASAQVQVVSDQQIVAVLADAASAIRAEMLRLASKQSITMSEKVRYEQMAQVRKAILEQQASVLRAVGRITEARRLEAASRAIKLGNEMDAYVLDRMGRTQLAQQILRGVTMGLERTTEVAMARMGYSYTALAQSIYNNDVWLGSRIDQRISSILAQGKSAREFAAEAVDWFNPHTPGGVKYAAMRLARSEINNAFHAVAVHQAQQKPWVHAMKWNLSGSHPKPDICNDMAESDHANLGPGVYPKADVPRKPHPQCFCYVTEVQASEDDFLDALTSGGYDDWIEQQRLTAEATPPVVPTPKSVAAGTRAKTAPATTPKRPSPATRATGTGRGGLTPTQLDAAKAMYGDFTKDVRLLDGMRVADLKRLAATYGLEGYGTNTRQVLLRRLKAKLSR